MKHIIVKWRTRVCSSAYTFTLNVSVFHKCLLTHPLFLQHSHNIYTLKLFCKVFGLKLSNLNKTAWLTKETTQVLWRHWHYRQTKRFSGMPEPIKSCFLISKWSYTSLRSCQGCFQHAAMDVSISISAYIREKNSSGWSVGLLPLWLISIVVHFYCGFYSCCDSCSCVVVFLFML